jgi:gamma-glutamylcyclotransferase (GGCT)/AIG2-like uncharacterized protein YtfP
VRSEPGPATSSRLTAALERLYEARRLQVAGESAELAVREALLALGVETGGDPAAELEASLGAPSTRLAAYGSLRPGEKHHDLLAPLFGRWWPGATTGYLSELDGYPVLQWAPSGPPVAVMVLETKELLSRWEDLDAFEGGDYVRSFVPVLTSGDQLVVASCYLKA